MGSAIIRTGLGEKDQAFEWLNRAADQRSLYLPGYHRAPVFDDLRSDPRFKQVQKKIGLDVEDIHVCPHTIPTLEQKARAASRASINNRTPVETG